MSAIPRPMEAVLLQRAPFERRALRNGLLTLGAWAAAIIAGIPLISVLYMLVVRGGARLGWEAVSSLPPAGFEMGGGFGNAIVGTFVMVGIGGLISIPIGVLAAVFLAELGPTRRLSQVARFATKTLTGIPSILAGVFAYAVVVLLTGTYSAPAGGLALAVLMLPTVILTAESAIRAVPKITRDAAYGMGCTRSQVVWKVLLPTATPGSRTSRSASGATSPSIEKTESIDTAAAKNLPAPHAIEPHNDNVVRFGTDAGRETSAPQE
jgi:phosphate transport system permease protein